MGLQQVREKGLNLINSIHVALADRYLQEIEQAVVLEPSSTLLMLQSIQKLMAERENIWPELCRLILIHLVEKVSDEELDYKEAFSQLAPAVKSIVERLGKI